MSNLLKGVSSLKVKEVPGFVSKYAGENLTKNKVEGRLTSWYHRYKKEHIDTGSFKPFQDLVVGVFLFSYVISWPKEYAHYKHEQEAKLAGGAAH
ncbi:hypothetical protein ACKKBG_A21040 [Auxenochlorella protothecoides x Auxenochlorella symbiontica]|uniref:ATP synthase subunit f, mitochondrial n=2 Tax=Auxenochlorella protothecoides TaxID=3075 RepID=A0A087SKL1_AUXPR|nr:hypothetical protein F751_4758 [Auxenochlorella protothecoides]KFM26265.1 hypothetical protein F751_4758 [Auxenochlorella protothecoides]RMZ56766.1 hypothetical protein APUTEX25_002855 [Auxenochlorella protothecoides]|eukprot:RMZ56766.1 hypothetical protein APUTEX25_002855 [Auxenochlorella protothecoides]